MISAQNISHPHHPLQSSPRHCYTDSIIYTERTLGSRQCFIKVYIEFVTVLFPFYIWVFWLQGMWDQIKPTPPTLEGKVLTTGPQGKFPKFILFFHA